MSTFKHDLSEARTRELQDTVDRLKAIGDESESVKTFPGRRAQAVRDAVAAFPKSDLPYSVVAGLVGLTYEMVRLIADGAQKSDEVSSK
jgi:hypothetical protein